jgi:glycosyltransferase involved in cell wall biosynthesis
MTAFEAIACGKEFMRIVHIVNSFMPELGYTEYYLAKKQREIGHDVCVVTSNRHIITTSKQFRKSFSRVEEGVRVFRLPRLIQFSGYVLVPINELKNVLSNLSPDVVHIHDALSPMAFASALYKHTFGYKIVADVITGMVIVHGLSLAIKTTLLKMYAKTIWSYVLDRIDCFFACSEAATNWMNRELNVDPSRIRFVPLGTDSDLFCFDPHKRLAVREKLGFTDNNVVAIYTGKVLPYKRLDTLLYASAPLIKAFSDFRILLVGEGANQYVNYLKVIANDLNISPRVTFHPAVHRTELPSFYNAADFAVWPGHHSISIIEAMSTGLPIIIPKSEWMSHLLKLENGFSYHEGDVAELRKRIRILLNNVELRREMGKRSRKLVEQELSWNKIAEEYLGIYDSLLED